MPNLRVICDIIRTLWDNSIAILLHILYRIKYVFNSFVKFTHKHSEVRLFLIYFLFSNVQIWKYFMWFTHFCAIMEFKAPQFAEHTLLGILYCKKYWCRFKLWFEISMVKSSNVHSSGTNYCHFSFKDFSLERLEKYLNV
jgi:hypothetical protein